jgi:hypothetical protein
MTRKAATPGLAPGERSVPGRQWASGRRLYLDNLKVVLIAAIIAVHAILGYAGTIDVWPYASVREVTLWPSAQAVLFAAAGPFAFFMIALSFLVAGLLTRPSLERKGVGAYVRDRLLRLGVPFAAYVLLLAPALSYALEHPLGLSRLLPGRVSRKAAPPGNGPAVVRGRAAGLLTRLCGPGRRQAARPGPEPGRRHHPAALAAACRGGSTRVVPRPAGVPHRQRKPAVRAELLGVAGLYRGVHARHHRIPARLATAVPDRLRRQCRAATLLAVAAMAAFLLVAGLLDEINSVLGGPRWPALVFAAIESLLVVFGPVWLLAVAQQRRDRPMRLGPCSAGAPTARSWSSPCCCSGWPWPCGRCLSQQS